MAAALSRHSHVAALAANGRTTFNGYGKPADELDGRRSPFKTNKMMDNSPQVQYEPRRPSPTHSADGFSSTSARTPPFRLVHGGAPNIANSTSAGSSAPASVQAPYTPLRTKSPQTAVIAMAAPPQATTAQQSSISSMLSWCPSVAGRTFVNSSAANGGVNLLSASHNSHNGGLDISSSSSLSSDVTASTSMMNLGAIIDATLNDVAGSVCGSGGSDGTATAVASSTANVLASSDVFVRRLIDAVRREPCLYNPNHEHYGNKHSSAQFRSTVWQNLCKDLDYPEDAHSLQAQWKRIRDRYVRERRKRKSATDDTTKLEADLAPHYMSAAARQFEWMRWIDDFLSDSAVGSAAICGSGFYTITNGEASSRRDAEHYFSQHPSRKCGSGAKLRDNTGHEYFNDGTEKSRSRIVPKIESSGSPNSSNSEISVGSAIFGSAAPPSQVMTTMMMDPSTGQFYHQHSPAPSNNTATNQQQQQQHRMYRLVTGSTSDMSQHLLNQSTQQQSQLSHQILSHPQTQQQSHSGNNLSNYTSNPDMHAPRRKRLAPGAHHNSDTIMSLEHHDGILHQSSQQHIEQGVGTLISSQNRAESMHGQNATIDSMLLQHDNLQRQYMASTQNVGASRHHLQQQHSLTHAPHHHHGRQQQQPQYIIGNPSTSVILNEAAVNPASPIQYDPDATLVEMIVGHFGNLNDDEKVVTKMNIQRILMDARFGRGSCVRMFREEEQNIEGIAMEPQTHHQQQRHPLHHQPQPQQRQPHHQQQQPGSS